MSSISEQRQITKNEVVAHRCDVCHAQVRVNDEKERYWHTFSSYHSEWEGATEDTYERWDVCSPSCYLKLINKLLDDNKCESRSFEINNMSYDFAKKLVELFEKFEKENGE